MNPITELSRFEGALLGLAVGDALGTTLEFQPPGSFEPLKDLVGGGPFQLQAGQWTDDTAMALCLANSLLESPGLNLKDQMERYCRWYKDGYLSSTGSCFDIGNTVRTALERYLSTGEPLAGSSDPRSAGNGSLMRLAPAVMYFYPQTPQAINAAIQSSRTTHAAPECLEACALFAEYLLRAFTGLTKEAILAPPQNVELKTPSLQAIASGNYQTKTKHQIRGSGYVVESLEAALWCFFKTANYAEAVLSAANLGNDADTTAAITGQLAGAYYGRLGIPTAWLTKLYQTAEIQTLAQALYRAQAA